MGIADLGRVLKIFSGSQMSAAEKKELFQEVLLMVLARACSADTNINAAEVEDTIAIIKRETGKTITEQDVRRAARTELYESTPLDKYLASVSRQLTNHDRVAVVQLLGEIIRSDTNIRPMEIEFFNSIVTALNVTPAEIAGLIKD